VVALRLSAQNPVLSVGPTDLIIDDAPRPYGPRWYAQIHSSWPATLR
jgi:hypothetical protein